MTASLSPAAAPDELTPDQLELQQRARTFVEDVLMPLEVEAERRGGRLPEEDVKRIRQEAIAARLQGGRFAAEHGGQGWSMLEWFLVNEQFGRVTNGLHWHVPNAYNVLTQGTPQQVDKYLRPILRGEGGDTAYAVTEAAAGSDPSGIATSAERSDGGWVLNGEKWFVTSGGVANVLIVMANAADGGPTLFLVEPGASGVEIVDDPAYTHNYPHGHPTIRFTNVELPDDAVIGGVGNGDALQRAWFTEERLGIATHGLGAMWRLLHGAPPPALTHGEGGAPDMGYQGGLFPLAGSATDAPCRGL